MCNSGPFPFISTSAILSDVLLVTTGYNALALPLGGIFSSPNQDMGTRMHDYPTQAMETRKLERWNSV